jgi:hypothetical protein
MEALSRGVHLGISYLTNRKRLRPQLEFCL